MYNKCSDGIHSHDLMKPCSTETTRCGLELTISESWHNFSAQHSSYSVSDVPKQFDYLAQTKSGKNVENNFETYQY